jgi:hypothetical protein
LLKKAVYQKKQKIMKKKISIVIAILMANVVISQTQASLFSGVSIANINSEDFSDSRAIGLGIGISASMFLTQKSDLIVELGYEFKTFSPSFYNDFNNKPININSTSIGINNITISSLYNYYLLTPENNGFYVTAQAGLGTTLYNKWSTDDSELATAFEGGEHFKPFYIIGGSIGFENWRMSVRYNKSFGNILSEVSVLESNSNNSISDERYLNATISYFSINLPYLTDFQF